MRFEHAHEMLGIAKEREIEKTPVLVQKLKKRLEVAQDCLQQPEDRWDYEQIKTELENLRWEIIDAEERLKNANKQRYLFSNEEAAEIVQKYNADIKPLIAEYTKSEAEVLKLTKAYAKSVRPYLNTMSEISSDVRAIQNIKSMIPPQFSQEMNQLQFKREPATGHGAGRSIQEVINYILNNAKGVI